MPTIEISRVQHGTDTLYAARTPGSVTACTARNHADALIRHTRISRKLEAARALDLPEERLHRMDLERMLAQYEAIMAHIDGQ